MGRILGIDVGRKRVGIAVTDPLQLIANSLTTVAAHEAIDFIAAYLAKEKVDKIVVGYPKQMNNTPSEAVSYVEDFLKKCKKKFPAYPIELVDERFTSKMAFQTMIEGGVKKEKRKKKELIDQISATIILQSYLDMKRED